MSRMPSISVQNLTLLVVWHCVVSLGASSAGLRAVRRYNHRRGWGDSNLCSDGKLLPRLYILGAQKTGSTALAYKLMNGGVVTALKGDVPDGKEWHFFDRRMSGHELQSADESEKLRQEWLSHLPACPQDESKQLVADFSIINLPMVPLPDGLKGTGTSWGWWWKKDHGPTAEVNLPQSLVSLYGQEPSRKVGFIVMLREPLARMQSAWYHAKAGGWEGVCRECHADTFEESVKNTIAAASQTPAAYHDWLWHSMYGPQIAEYVRHFDHNQFYITLFKDFAKRDLTEVCREVSDWIEYSTDCAKEEERQHQNTNPHKSLSEDITAELRTNFDAVMAPWNQKLYELLASGSDRGMRLAGYPEEIASAEGVRAWVEAGW